ncbi:hypothetical protein ABMA28_006013 [Loxostege sticticalis]|uniref:UDP-glucuronosyltransferase n=1 Tax=Loxostege sticticalis TaxID=481309 RepID=A0ABD0SJP9_LOXSC
MKLPVAVLLATLCLHVGDSYRIFVVFPMPGRSHTILGDGVVRHLAAAGHDITYVTPSPKKNVPKNVRQIDVSDNFNHFPTEELNLKRHIEGDTALDISSILGYMLTIHNVTFHNPNVREILVDPNEQFDLVIVEWMFSELYSGFGAILGTPFIWVSTVEPHWLVLRLIDEASSPAFTADIMGSGLPPFSFKERVSQLFTQIFIRGIKFFDNSEDKIYSSLAPYFKARGRQQPPLQEIAFNASLMFGNSHVSLGQAMTLPENYKGIGGYHIDSKLPPIPDDLQKVLDNAKHGVIYFSMGSNLKSKDLPDELKKSLLKMFSEIKYTVIWKFEEVLPGVPDNVHIIQWAPQPSILAHPKCVLFITHGGLLSTTETIHYGKPIIGIPVFADQFINVERAVAKGFAKRVDLSMTMADQLKSAINEILQDPKYTTTVKELSFIYHDRPTTPGAELVHWTEHVIKTKGAPHLRSAALAVPFYQKLYLDLLALTVAILLVIRAVVLRIFKKSSKKEKTQ